MRMRSKCIGGWLLLCAFIVVSCGNSAKEKEWKVVEQALTDLNIGSNYEWVVIIPGTGCHGCIIGGEMFMKEHIQDERILFVLVNPSSLKILQQKLELDLSDYSNVVIDKEERYHLPIDNSIYPCVIELKDGELQGYSFQSPSTSALHELEQQLLISE